jgi:hypothetical protein
LLEARDFQLKIDLEKQSLKIHPSRNPYDPKADLICKSQLRNISDGITCLTRKPTRGRSEKEGVTRTFPLKMILVPSQCPFLCNRYQNAAGLHRLQEVIHGVGEEIV